MDSDDATSRTSTSLLAGSVHYAAIWHTRRTLSVELRLHRYGNARSRTTSFDPTVNPHDRESAMQTLTKHYIDGTFVESHGSEVMDIIKPTNRQVIARVTMANEQDAKRAIAAAKSAFITFG